MSLSVIDHKVDIPFYKDIYDRERDRCFILDDAISQPITICSILVALLYFLYTSTPPKDHSCLNLASLLSICLAFAAFLICRFFLARSYNDLFYGFAYEELPSTTAIRKYQEDLITYNSTQEVTNQPSFDEYLLRNYVKCADSYIIINDKRSLHLHFAKTSMISALGLTIIGIILFIIKSQP